MVRRQRLASARTPPAVTRPTPEVGPFGQIRSSQNHRTRVPEFGDGRILARRLASKQGKRAGGGLEGFVRDDVVFDEDRHSVDGTETAQALVVTFLSIFK